MFMASFLQFWLLVSTFIMEQVTLDELDILQNVKSVIPWLVILVSNTPAIQMTPFTLSKKLQVT